MKNHAEKRHKKILELIDTRVIWIIAGLITLTLHFVLSAFPEFVEAYYSNGFFIGVRYCFDYTIGLIPFSLFYFLLMFILGSLIYRVFMWVRLVFMVKLIPLGLKFKLLIISILSFASKIVVAFSFLWGFNYHRIPIEQKLDLEMTHNTEAMILTEFHIQRKKAIETRMNIKFYKNNVPTLKDIPENLDEIVKENLEDVMKDFGYEPVGNPAMRFIKPFGFLSSFGITGYYNPFLGEANMDRGFRPLYIPFLYAHELAHAYGFADEGTANFLAYMACERSSHPFVKYSGRIIYLQYLAHHIKDVNIVWNPYVFEDLLMSGFFVYDPKYDRMIDLILAFKKKND
ncbi:MAG: DUF3810 family protein [Crocinitomicaceae bacterium]|nr:DUF3810 family protein [Crocinitomicaceae bacterium]